LIIKITGKQSNYVYVHIDDVLIAFLRKEIIFAEVLSLKILIGMRSKTDFFIFSQVIYEVRRKGVILIAKLVFLPESVRYQS
jgi:hypothetical protein